MAERSRSRSPRSSREPYPTPFDGRVYGRQTFTDLIVDVSCNAHALQASCGRLLNYLWLGKGGLKDNGPGGDIFRVVEGKNDGYRYVENQGNVYRVVQGLGVEPGKGSGGGMEPGKSSGDIEPGKGSGNIEPGKGNVESGKESGNTEPGKGNIEPGKGMERIEPGKGMKPGRAG